MNPPSARWLGGVGVVLAVIAQRGAANKLTCVVAFMCGLVSANAALDLGVLLTNVAFTLRFAGTAPREDEFAITHLPSLSRWSRGRAESMSAQMALQSA